MRGPGDRTRGGKHLGEMRTSQLVTSYGVGAMVDFRDETAILAEADGWYREDHPEDHERVIHCHNLEKILGVEFFVKSRLAHGVWKVIKCCHSKNRVAKEC